MTAPENPIRPPKRRRRRLRWLALGLLVLLAVLAAAHRPILVFAVRQAAVRWAARQHVELSLEVRGNVLTQVTLSNIRARAIGRSPVDAIDIESVQIQYDPIRLLRRGVRDFISGYRLRNAKLELTPAHGTPTQQEEIAKVLRDILQQPALFSDRVQVENLNVKVNTDHGPYVLGGAHALLDPTGPGYLRLEELTIPRIASWRGVEAVCSFNNRHLIARNFHLGNEVLATRLELDASQRSKGINYLSFEGTVLGADTGLFLWRHEVNRFRSEAELTAYFGGLSLQRLHDFLRWKPELSGTVGKAWLRLAGDPSVPSQWHGNATLEAAGAIEGFRIERLVGELRIAQGKLRLEDAAAVTGVNRMKLRAERTMPESAKSLLSEGIEVGFDVDAPQPARVHRIFSGGALRGSGVCRFNGDGITLSASSALTNTSIDPAPGHRAAVGNGTVTFQMTHQFDHGTQRGAGFHAGLIGSGTDLRIGPCGFDRGTVTARFERGRVEIESAELLRPPNAVRFSGKYEKPKPGIAPSWANARFGLHFAIEAPSLNTLATDPERTPLKGALSASGDLHRADGRTSGHARVEGNALVYRQFTAQHLSIDLPIEADKARIAAFRLSIDDQDAVEGAGSMDLRPPYAYEGRLSGTVRDLGIFQPLAGTPLGGTLKVDWCGSGALNGWQHTGEGSGTWTNGRVGDLTGIDAEAAGQYSPDSIVFDTLRARSSRGSVEAKVRLRDGRLRVDPLRVEIQKIATLNGAFSLPVDLRAPNGALFPNNGALEGTLSLGSLDLAAVVPRKSLSSLTPIAARTEPVGKRSRNAAPPKAVPVESAPSLHGSLSGELTLSGSVGAPQLSLILKATGLRAAAAPGLPPCSAATTAVLRDDHLLINGALSQPGIAPLQWTAALPLSLAKMLRERRIDPEMPLAAAIKLPASPATLLPLVIPEIRYVEGRVAIDASATGTLEHPILNGGIVFNVPAVRFLNTNAPGISNLRGDLRFTGSELIVKQLQGDVAGGPFAISGRAVLDDLSAPRLDLRFRSQGTLLVRNDSLTLRADSDLKVAGPWASAAVTGNVGIAKSQFFRDVDILPLGLPGRPTPKSAGGPPKFSMDITPVRGWTFDVAVKTTEPLAVRGNLANGQAFADLRLGGNGLAPTLQGTARIENFVASLPFSRLTIDYGYLYFSPDAPFNPTLDIRGSSRIRDYNIGVSIYGTAEEPQTVFTSEPPLAQEEVIALLATGATSKEFVENKSVLAGRAGVLLLQDLYHKVFKRRSPTAEAKPDEPLNRFSLDVGTVDPRTGRQELGGRFKLSNQYEIGAGVDVQGDVQVQLRYLLRFR